MNEQFAVPKVQARRSILLCAMLGLAACVSGPPIVIASSVGCAGLLPVEWRAGVAGAALPDGLTVGDWIVFGDAQTGKLDEANGRTRDAIGIVERCEARDGAAVRRARRGWLRRLVG
ncbi:hypothetical protein [Sphingomonas sp.]|uniref:hypothetical protein n=1 Tax=Sphingomonas sp. TaxID=28214 RepID=UPI00286D5ED5|nr:hypothetical protein [Sphingomonas sp.]